MENTGGGGELTLIVGFCQMFTQVTTKRSFPENNQTNDLLWFVQFTPSKIRAVWQIQGFFKTTAQIWSLFKIVQTMDCASIGQFFFG